MTTYKSALTTAVGYTFHREELLTQALKHPSLDIGLMDNQRLEFLGDAVLGLVVADALYQSYPDQAEGELDRMRANLVSGKSLAKKAGQLELQNYLEVSEAQRKHRPEPSPGMLEDALEALIGAIYLDGGLVPARTFIEKIFSDELAEAGQAASERSPKTQLQEWSQEHHAGARPDYTLLETNGPAHQRNYTVEVRIADRLIASGTGTSKKNAEVAAAANALQTLKT